MKRKFSQTAIFKSSHIHNTYIIYFIIYLYFLELIVYFVGGLVLLCVVFPFNFQHDPQLFFFLKTNCVSVCVCFTVQYINMNQFPPPCLLLLPIWLPIQCGLLLRPQPLLLLGVIDFGCQRRRSEPSSHDSLQWIGSTP